MQGNIPDVFLSRTLIVTSTQICELPDVISEIHFCVFQSLGSFGLCELLTFQVKLSFYWSSRVRLSLTCLLCEICTVTFIFSLSATSFFLC